MFIDADDVLCGYGSLYLLWKCLQENPAARYVISDFQHTVDCMKDMNEINPLVSFGHLYRREFIEKYDIRFLSGIFFEDIGFNLLCQTYAKEDEIIYYNATTYEWISSETSYTHKMGDFYGKVLGVPGYVYNSYKIFEHLEQHNIDLSTVGFKILTAILHTYFYYNTLLVRDTGDEVIKYILEATETLGKIFYQKYYPICKKSTTKSDLSRLYMELSNSYLINNQDIDFELKISLQDFINFMLTSPVDKDINYKEIERKLFNLGKNITLGDL